MCVCVCGCLRACVCACLHVCMCVCISVCLSISVCLFVSVSVCLCLSLHLCIAYVGMCMYKYMAYVCNTGKRVWLACVDRIQYNDAYVCTYVPSRVETRSAHAPTLIKLGQITGMC